MKMRALSRKCQEILPKLKLNNEKPVVIENPFEVLQNPLKGKSSFKTKIHAKISSSNDLEALIDHRELLILEELTIELEYNEEEREAKECAKCGWDAKEEYSDKFLEDISHCNLCYHKFGVDYLDFIEDISDRELAFLTENLSKFSAINFDLALIP